MLQCMKNKHSAHTIERRCSVTMETYKDILSSVVIDLRNLCENDSKSISAFAHEFLWDVIQGIEHDIAEIEKKNGN